MQPRVTYALTEWGMGSSEPQMKKAIPFGVGRDFGRLCKRAIERLLKDE